MLKNIAFILSPSYILTSAVVTYWWVRGNGKKGIILTHRIHIRIVLTPVLLNLFLGNKNIFAFSYHFSTLRWHIFLTFILVGDKDWFIQHIQYDGCWWPSDTRRQGISSSGIDFILLEHSGFRTTGFSPSICLIDWPISQIPQCTCPRFLNTPLLPRTINTTVVLYRYTTPFLFGVVSVIKCYYTSNLNKMYHFAASILLYDIAQLRFPPKAIWVQQVVSTVFPGV